MLYRTKATMEILMGLTARDALELLKMVRHIQKRFYIGMRMIPFDKLPKDDAHDRIQCILNDGTLDISVHLRGPLEHFLEVMVEERAPMDMLVEEYNTALGRVFQLELFKTEITEDGLPGPEKLDPTPEGSTKVQDTPHPGTAGSKDGPGDRSEKESEERRTLSGIADRIVDGLMQRNMTFCEMLSVIDTAQMDLKAERASYRRRLDATPIKELWEIGGREQQERRCKGCGAAQRKRV